MNNTNFIDVKLPLIEACAENMKKSAKKYQNIAMCFEKEIQNLSEDEALKSMVIDAGMLEMIKKSKEESKKMQEQCNAYADFLINTIITNYHFTEQKNQKEIETLDDFMDETSKRLGDQAS